MLIALLDMEIYQPVRLLPVYAVLIALPMSNVNLIFVSPELPPKKMLVVYAQMTILLLMPILQMDVRQQLLQLMSRLHLTLVLLDSALTNNQPALSHQTAIQTYAMLANAIPVKLTLITRHTTAPTLTPRNTSITQLAIATPSVNSQLISTTRVL